MEKIDIEKIVNHRTRLFDSLDETTLGSQPHKRRVTKTLGMMVP